MRKLLATAAATAAGITFKIVQSAEVDWSRNYIVMANHSSILDITAVLRACPIPIFDLPPASSVADRRLAGAAADVPATSFPPHRWKCRAHPDQPNRLIRSVLPQWQCG